MLGVAVPSMPLVAGPPHWVPDEIADHKFNIDDLISVAETFGR